MHRIPFAIPDLDQAEINEVVDTLNSGWITTGPKVKRFEENFKEYIGAKHALAVNSATSGLHLALDAIGIQAQDKVIVPVNTFTSTAEVVRYFDADPIFCDIEKDSFNICIKSLKHILNTYPKKDKIKAIMPVHIAGQACDMDPILKLAKEYNLKIIEDAAHALPTTYKGKLVGTIGDITVYSFYATKTLCTGEGGMITTNNDNYAKRIKVMRLHGFDRDAWDRYNTNKPSWYYSIIAPGFKYNMPDLNASLGIHQLKKVDNFYEKRKSIAKKYDQAFKELPQIQTPYVVNKNDKHAYHLYILKVPQRDKFIEELAKKGVGTSVHFIPLHIQPYWKNKYNLNENDFPNAINNFQAIMSLPIYTKLQDDEIDYIIKSVKEIYEKLI
jgi:dTDP-4-amino-4,6-dideoxygalactose transaminase